MDTKYFITTILMTSSPALKHQTSTTSNVSPPRTAGVGVLTTIGVGVRTTGVGVWTRSGCSSSTRPTRDPSVVVVDAPLPISTLIKSTEMLPGIRGQLRNLTHLTPEIMMRFLHASTRPKKTTADFRVTQHLDQFSTLLKPRKVR